jgi:hypothetical protein
MHAPSSLSGFYRLDLLIHMQCLWTVLLRECVDW